MTFELTKETTKYLDTILYRIIATEDKGNVRKGDLGGFVESEDNLSYYGECWISDNAKVFGNARATDDVQISGNAIICDNALVLGGVIVSGNAIIHNNALVSGRVMVCGNSIIAGHAQVKGRCFISGKAHIRNNTKIEGNAVIAGNAVIDSYDCSITGDVWIEQDIEVIRLQKFNVVMTDDHFGIDSEVYPHHEFLCDSNDILKRHGCSGKEINYCNLIISGLTGLRDCKKCTTS